MVQKKPTEKRKNILEHNVMATLALRMAGDASVLYNNAQQAHDKNVTDLSVLTKWGIELLCRRPRLDLIRFAANQDLSAPFTSHVRYLTAMHGVDNE